MARDLVILSSFAPASIMSRRGEGVTNTELSQGGHRCRCFVARAPSAADLDPEWPGLEIFKANGDRQNPSGRQLRDAKSGAQIWGIASTGRRGVGRALALDITTTVPTEHRLYTLMHDPIYRLSVAWQNVAYNQPAHPGFFLGHGMRAPPRPSIRTPVLEKQNADRVEESGQ